MSTLIPSPLLRFALALDAGVSGLIALAQLLLTDWLAGATLLPSPLLLVTGVFMAIYAGVLLWCVFQRSWTAVSAPSWTVFQRDHGRSQKHASDGVHRSSIVHDGAETPSGRRSASNAVVVTALMV